MLIRTDAVFAPLLKPARYKGAWGGRGSGKSHFFAETMIERSATQKLDCVCLREIQRSLEFSVKKLLEVKIESLNAGAYFEVQDRRILSKHGGHVIFEGLQNHTSDSIKSLEGFDIAWTEEAQALSQRSLDLLRPTIRKPASELWFSWNPDLPSDPVDALLRSDMPPPDAVIVQANYADNHRLPAVLREEMEFDRSCDPDKYAHVWLGEYRRNSSARVFKNWEVREFDIQPDWILRQGADWGFSVDPSVLVQVAIVGRSLYVPFEAYGVGVEIDRLPDLFLQVPDAEKWPLTADSARPETISYLRKHGFPKITSAVKGARSLEEGVEFLKSFDLVVHPRCYHLIKELSLYSYRTDPLTGQVLPMLQDKHNHVIDALRYALEAARRLTRDERRGPEPVRESHHGTLGWMLA